MKISKVYKSLYLLNLLFRGACTKDYIIEQFAKNNMSITKPLITHYINEFVEKGFDVEFKINQKRQKVYYFKTTKPELNFTIQEMAVISDVKKLFISQKKYKQIRLLMRIFYEVSKYINNQETLEEFINFGYYSTLNWHLVGQLEAHCKNKNMIVLDYLLPSGGNKILNVHAHGLKVSEWSDRLYLHCVLEGANAFSTLPVDRIFMVKKILEKNKEFDLGLDNLTYVVSKKVFDELEKDPHEKVVRIEDDKITLQRMSDDDFYTLQRLLSFCPDVYYISDNRVAKLYKEKLEMIKAVYDERIE